MDSLPGLARIAAGAWVRVTAWGLSEALRFGVRLGQAATDPRAAAQLVSDVRTGMRAYAREFLGIADLDARVSEMAPGVGRFMAGSAPAAAMRRRSRSEQDGAAPSQALRELGAELLRQSADVTIDDEIHPAYARILEEIAPDEARILRLLAVEGPQPIVDVRSLNLIGVGSQLIAQGLNMIGPTAGTRHHERVPAYLNNLQRLGLVSFSEEPLDDSIRYQVLEAQPDVLNAIKSTSRAKTIQRSIHLTAFGKDFCDVCLPMQTGEIEALGPRGG